MALPKQWKFYVFMLFFILLIKLVLLKPKISSAEFWHCNKIIMKLQLNCLSRPPLWERVGREESPSTPSANLAWRQKSDYGM